MYSIDGGPVIFSAFDIADPSPLPPPGTSEVQGATSADGSFIYAELTHPLDTDDDLHDLSGTPGERVGFRVSLTLWVRGGTPPDSPTSHTTVLPLFDSLGDIYLSEGRPETFLDSGPAGRVRSTSVELTFSGDSRAANFSCSLDTLDWSPCTSPVHYDGLAQGAHTFRVRGEDEAGYEDDSPAAAEWVTDTIAPNTIIRSGPSKSVTAHRATFAFRSSEPGSTFACRLDGLPWRPCASPITFRGLGSGRHVFRVRAADAVGNVDPSPARRAWTIIVAEIARPARRLCASLTCFPQD